jgi:2'-5' RNA ligase
MIRAFVAIALPESVIYTLEACQAGLPSGRAVAPENLHLTVAFLGEHPAPVIEDVHLALARIRAPAFHLALDGIGLFGGGRPRVLYAGVRREPGLGHLRDKVLQAARGAGLNLPRERFSPHVSLARFKNGLKGEQLAEMQAFVARRMPQATGAFAVDEFILFRSTLGRKGPAYEELAAYPLGAGQYA